MNHYGVDADAFVRLAVAVVLGAAVGLERELWGQTAGLRTHMAVCLGACLFGVISTLGAFIHAMPHQAGSYEDRTSLMREIRREGIDL